jgi:hypothetical protein
MKKALVVVAALAAACQSGKKDQPGPEPTPVPEPATDAGTGSGPGGGSGAARNEIGRPEFNELAVRANLPVFWIGDANKDNNVDANEVATLLFYPPFEGDLDAAYAKILALKKLPLPDRSSPEGNRRALVIDDLAQGRAAIVHNDLSSQPEPVKAFAKRMLEVGKRIDALYLTMNGAAALATQVPANDTESQSLFRRNRGPKCVGPKTETEKECSAIRGAPEPMVDVYPAKIDGVAQTDESFCKKLEARPDAKDLLDPFTAVREVDSKLVAVPYNEAYKDQMSAIAGELTAAADALAGANEDALVAYLRAAATAFTNNDWFPADEAWAKMNVGNSKWYVRVGPDETYWEPCAHKAGFHLTLSRINQGLVEWQDKLLPIQQDMENAVAARAGAPYKPRAVTFHLPDFIDIVVNAGDDRSPLGATIGQSLPNVGPVAKESRGRTVATANLYTDADSVESARAESASLLDIESMKEYVDDPLPGLLSTTLHEATHNLGPAQEYAVKGKPVEDKFGGPMDQLIEELKAQTGALFLVELLRGKGIVSDALARQIYVSSIVWAFGQISSGMYTTVGHQRKTYPQLAAIQVGFLLDKGALTWDAKATAANGTDKGAFAIHLDKMVAASDEMMKLVAGIKARGDVRAAEALAKKYVDGKTVPFDAINERFRRSPRNSFVYSLTL